MRLGFPAVALVLVVHSAAAQSPAPLQFADLGRCATVGGTPVEQCRLGYRTYGRLNADRSNAVLVPTWGFGRSEDLVLLLGDDRWIDTTTSFVILVDKLGNGVSTSPSNSTAQPLARFPRLTMEDQAHAQYRLVAEKLGIPRLRAVVGWSMGGMQALAWAMTYPGKVDRVVSVAGTPRMGTYEMYFVRTQLNLLRLAARAGVPHDSLSLALAELWHLVGSTPAMENELPRDSVDAMLAREIHVELLRLHPEDNRAQLELVASFDAIRMAKAFRKGPAILLVFMADDHVTTAENYRTFSALTGARMVELSHRCGHMLPVCDPGLIGSHVRPFLRGEPAPERSTW